MTDELEVDLVGRLQRRYERERRARLEAEMIAQQGLRDLYSANRSLDLRIQERTTELEEATRKAEAADRAKGEFLSHAGHELRTPINGIAGMLELLDRVVTEPHSRDWLAAARESTDRLEHLVDRILWFIELETLDLSSVSDTTTIDAVVDSAAARWRQKCAGRGQLLSSEIATPVDYKVAKTLELDRALDELLGNAVAHASPGAVRLRTSADAGLVRFSVVDSGPGIAAETAESAAEALEPGQPPTTRTGSGAGMGFALVRRIALALGGDSGLDLTAEGGTWAWIAVPLARTV